MYSKVAGHGNFSFSCLAGIRSSHKLLDDPVVEGIASMFGQLLMVANEETKEAFHRLSREAGALVSSQQRN